MPRDPVLERPEPSLSPEKATRLCRELLTLIREIEWSAGGRSGDLVCPVCGAARAYMGTFTSPPPHQPDCRLAALLRQET